MVMGEGTCSFTYLSRQAIYKTSLNVAGSQIKKKILWGLGGGKVCGQNKMGQWGKKNGELIESDVIDIYLIIQVREKGHYQTFNLVKKRQARIAGSCKEETVMHPVGLKRVLQKPFVEQCTYWGGCCRHVTALDKGKIWDFFTTSASFSSMY